MAYVHCHECHWEQDDFWSLHYNPLTVLLMDIRAYWIPRMVHTESKVFSWSWLAKCICWRVSAPFRQKWWTWKSWRSAKNRACPKCGNGLCID